jgi:hypothetical protein
VAITIVGTGAADSASPFAPTLHASTTTDDIILILVEQVSLTTPEVSPSATGYAHVGSPAVSPVGPDSAQTVLSVLWKRAGASESAPTVSGPSNHGMTRTITIRGVKNTGNPWNVQPAVATEANLADTSANWPAVTTGVDGCLICFCIATGRDANNTANLGALSGGTGLTNATEQMDNWTATGTGGGIGLITADKATAGSTGTPTATMGTNDGKALLTLALEPAPPAAELPILVMAPPRPA